MASDTWFGYKHIPEAIMAWGARAIFKPHTNRPLDFLPDRQGHKYEEKDQLDFKLLCSHLNKVVIPALMIAVKRFSGGDSDKLVLHFDWPHDPALKIVAEGSPNASHGYFYIACNLVTKEVAENHPEIKR